MERERCADERWMVRKKDYDIEDQHDRICSALNEKPSILIFLPSAREGSILLIVMFDAFRVYSWSLIKVSKTQMHGQWMESMKVEMFCRQTITDADAWLTLKVSLVEIRADVTDVLIREQNHSALALASVGGYFP